MAAGGQVQFGDHKVEVGLCLVGPRCVLKPEVALELPCTIALLIHARASVGAVSVQRFVTYVCMFCIVVTAIALRMPCLSPCPRMPVRPQCTRSAKFSTSANTQILVLALFHNCA